MPENSQVLAKRIDHYKQHVNIFETFSLRMTCAENKEVTKLHEEVRLHLITP